MVLFFFATDDVNVVGGRAGVYRMFIKGHSAGEAFVEVKTMADLQNARAMNGMFMDSRCVSGKCTVNSQSFEQQYHKVPPDIKEHNLDTFSSQGALRFAPVCSSVCLSITLYGIEFV